jgi:hypothetical protein
MIEITISKTLWMNTVVRKLHPRSKTIAVVDFWYDCEDSINLEYNRSFDGYSNDRHHLLNFTAETVARILGYKSVKFNRDFSITAED